jgi:hypothetical protein
MPQVVEGEISKVSTGNSIIPSSPIMVPGVTTSTRKEIPVLTEETEFTGYGGNPRKAGRIGVGHVLYGAKFNHEFSPPAEDRPT